jgi:hypothetical protein
MNSSSNSTVQIREASSKKALNAFIKVPWSVYENDPNWVPPLIIERKESLSPKHPYFKHAVWQAWIAYRDASQTIRHEYRFFRADRSTG